MLALLKCLVVMVGCSQRARALSVCLDCLADHAVATGCASFCPANITCLRSIDLKHATLSSLAAPSLLCKEDSSLTFTWNHTNDMFYFLHYLSEPQEAKLTNFTRCPVQTITNTSADLAPVLVTLYAASHRKGQLLKSGPVEVRTSKVFKRTPVRNLSAALNLTEHGYTALVSWQPGSDLSCFYEVVWYGKRQPGYYSQRRLSLKKQIQPQFRLADLEFGRQYHFSIASIDGKGLSESSKRYLKISVPSCLDTFNNLSICAPAKPTHFAATKLLPSGLKLSWDKPQLLPLFYSIDLMAFKPSSNENGSFTMTCNASGETDWIILEDVSLGDHYMVKLLAHSRAGASPPAYIREFPSNSSAILTAIIQEEVPGSFFMWIFVGTGACVALILVLVLWQLPRKCLVKRFFPEEILAEPVVRYTTTAVEDSKWELVESRLLVDCVIGCGAFGIVQKGFYYLDSNKKTPVAIKTLKACPTSEQVAQFYKEIEIMKSVPYHAHIVFLFGVVTKQRPNNPFMLVEFCAKGDLQTFLKNVAFVLQQNPKSDEDHDGSAGKFFNKCYEIDLLGKKENLFALEAKDLLSFARQIAVGMEFLSNLKVIHRDLAARNVLITENNTLKISDFGLSRDIYTDNIYRKVTGGKLPFKWMALESLTHQVYTTESDVWSFGIVLWEIITLGGNPYPAVNTEDLVALLKKGYRMERPVNCSEELYQTMLDCWKSSPNLRPTFKQLRETFDRLLESEVQYINLQSARNLEEKSYENMDGVTSPDSCSN